MLHPILIFVDLNNDGCLTYKDFLWAKDKICYMSGWKIDSPKYKITEALFHEIWESLEIIADVDKDGKITKKEWVRYLRLFSLRLFCRLLLENRKMDRWKRSLYKTGTIHRKEYKNNFNHVLDNL